MKRLAGTIWIWLKAIGRLWPWRKKTPAEQQSRDLMRYLLRDKQGRQLLNTLRKQRKRGQASLDFAHGSGRDLMEYLLRDEQGRQLLTTMMPNRQGRRNASRMPVKGQPGVRKAAAKDQPKKRRWSLPWAGRSKS